MAALAVSPGVAHADDWWGADKRLHLGAGAVIPPVGFLISGTFLDGNGARLAFGAGLGLTAGAAKELYDLAGHGDPSWKDFTWDAIGTLLGVSATWTVMKLTASNRPPSAPLTTPAVAPASVAIPAVTPASGSMPAVAPASVRPPVPPPADAPTLDIRAGQGGAHDPLMLRLVYSAR